MELISSCYSIKKLENNICKRLVAKGQAEILHDSTQADNNLSTIHYSICIGEDSAFRLLFGSELSRVSVRFWYDKHVDRAGIKFTEEGFNMIRHSISAVSLLRQLGVKMQNGKGFSPDEIKSIIRQAAQVEITEVVKSDGDK